MGDWVIAGVVVLLGCATVVLSVRVWAATRPVIYVCVKKERPPDDAL